DARIEIEQEAPQPYLPTRPVVALEQVAQRGSLGAEASRRQDAAAQPLPQSLNRSRGSKLWRDGQKMNANGRAMLRRTPVHPPGRQACVGENPHRGCE